MFSRFDLGADRSCITRASYFVDDDLRPLRPLRPHSIEAITSNPLGQVSRKHVYHHFLHHNRYLFAQYNLRSFRSKLPNTVYDGNGNSVYARYHFGWCQGQETSDCRSRSSHDLSRRPPSLLITSCEISIRYRSGLRQVATDSRTSVRSTERAIFHQKKKRWKPVADLVRDSRLRWRTD